MAGREAPLILKLAPLPRTQIGPFLILGVDKDATREEIEAAWAQRLIWARKGQTPVPLEDINWAREVLCDAERRLRADVVSLTIDTADATLRKLRQQFLEASAAGQPIDIEPDLSGYQPNLPTIDAEEFRSQLQLPELPREIPAVPILLREEYAESIDPWGFSLEEAPPTEG